MTPSELDLRNPNFHKLQRDGRNYTAPYEFHEYPKWVKLADGTGITVNDADEELAALGELSEAEQSTAAAAAAGENAVRRKAGRPSKAEIEARAAVAAAAAGASQPEA